MLGVQGRSCRAERRRVLPESEPRAGAAPPALQGKPEVPNYGGRNMPVVVVLGCPDHAEDRESLQRGEASFGRGTSE